MSTQLTPTEQALLDYLRRDALETGEISSFDPGWFITALEVAPEAVDAAGRRLASLGLVEIFAFPPAAPHPLTLTDIRLTARGLDPTPPR